MNYIEPPRDPIAYKDVGLLMVIAAGLLGLVVVAGRTIVDNLTEETPAAPRKTIEGVLIGKELEASGAHLLEFEDGMQVEVLVPKAMPIFMNQYQEMVLQKNEKSGWEVISNYCPTHERVVNQAQSQ